MEEGRGGSVMLGKTALARGGVLPRVLHLISTAGQARLSGDFPYLSRLLNQHWLLSCFSLSPPHSHPASPSFPSSLESLISRHFY